MYDLNVILPVYNERQTIRKIIAKWSIVLNKFNLAYQFLICEDGSTDGTNKLLEKLKKNYRISLISHIDRLGYGKAIISGIRSAESKYILCVDSDGQYNPADFAKFWSNRDSADIIFGWTVRRSDPLHRLFFSSLFKFAFSLLFGLPVHDPSNPLTLFKKKTILPHLTYLTYLSEGFWWGFIGMCVKKKLSIIELPIQHRKRQHGTTSIFHLKTILPIGFKNLIGLIKLKLVI